MTELRFDNRVAVITGGGRGLGREYALLLASRGAKVLINDNGSSLTGEGHDDGPAQAVVDEIRAMGGEAVACTESVATPEGGKAIIDVAFDSFGRVDVLIHSAGNSVFHPLDTITHEDFRKVVDIHLLGGFNVIQPLFPRMRQAGYGRVVLIHSAGNSRFCPLETLSHEEFRSVVDIHLLGGFNVVQPCFPLMRKAGYGRVVLTGSIGGIYSMPTVAGYAVSKSGMIGLNNIVAIEGADRNITSNIILPGASTRMSEGIDTSQFPPMGPEMVAPVVGWLAHEACSISGEMLVSTAGRVARAFVTESQGVYEADWTIEKIADQIDAIRDPARQWTFHPARNGFGEHLERSFAMAREGD
jgi:NAD(P)-dependent dehydrogenase (short-subunit alcohol dehydrogenase family)